MNDEDAAAFEAYSKIAEQINKEDGLIRDRVTWGTSINGGLLAVFGVSYAFGRNLFEKVSGKAILLGSVGVIVLSAIAILVCCETIRGIRDARKQIYYIRSIYESKWKTKVEDNLGLPRPFFSRELDVDRHIPAWRAGNIFLLMIVLWLWVILAMLIGAATRMWQT